MAVAWFLAPVKRRDLADRATLYIGMDDFTEAIRADGGSWNGVYVGPSHNRALCKVRATSTTLATIAAEPGMLRIPVSQLDTTLASLTVGQRSAIVTALTGMGYTAGEVTAAFPDLRAATLRQLLSYVTSRRRHIRYDTVTDSFVADGDETPAEPHDDIDRLVP